MILGEKNNANSASSRRFLDLIAGVVGVRMWARRLSPRILDPAARASDLEAWGYHEFRCIRLELKGWLDEQVAPKRVELNSGSGKAIAQRVKADGSLLA